MHLEDYHIKNDFHSMKNKCYTQLIMRFPKPFIFKGRIPRDYTYNVVSRQLQAKSKDKDSLEAQSFSPRSITTH